MNLPAPLPETPRLLLRRYTRNDLDALDQLNSNPEVMRYLGGVASREDTRQMLDERILAYYDQHPGLGVWATIERDSGAHLGFHLLNHIRGESYIQIGYRLFPQYWGRGYATEMTIALLRYGYTALALPRITAITALDNRGSQHVLLKSGLLRGADRDLPHPVYIPWGPLAWFERERGEWLAQMPPPAV
jgi:ribosomal-protein-alanine N-acetyltransferase